MPPFRGIRAHSGTPAAEDHPFHAMIEYHRMPEIARDFFIFSLRKIIPPVVRELHQITALLLFRLPQPAPTAIGCGRYRLSKNLPGYKYRREGYHRLARANTPDSVSFRRFLLFSPWLAPASLRLKNQKSLENTSLAGAEQFCRSRNAFRQEKTRREYLPYCQGA